MIQALSVVVGLFYIPLTVYQSWLLYNHVHATELMWFLWLIQIPFMIFSATLSVIISKIKK